MNLKQLLSAFIFAGFLTGCATAPIPTNYGPSSTKSASGSLSVSDFSYSAKGKTGTPVKPNVIRNTAAGEVLIDKEVRQFVRDAVFSELRFVGVKTDNTNKVLTGDIEEFLIDDLGFTIDWTLRIKYKLTDSSKKEIYSAVKETKRKTAKFANPFGALNETIKISVEQLLDDPEFIKAIK